MPDDASKHGPADPARVNVNETWELRYWCKHLNVTPEQLRWYVASYGVMAADVRRQIAADRAKERLGGQAHLPKPASHQGKPKPKP